MRTAPLREWERVSNPERIVNLSMSTSGEKSTSLAARGLVRCGPTADIRDRKSRLLKRPKENDLSLGQGELRPLIAVPWGDGTSG
jgi:hypothetical protein